MTILADTHILLWQLVGDQRLRGRLREPLLDTTSDVWVSDVSFWEIAIKVQTGKLMLSLPTIEAFTEEQRYRRLAIKRGHIASVADLPRHHGDPFDHLLIAQCIVEDFAMLTADTLFAKYPVKLAA